MSKTILTDVDGFTPAIDVLVQQYGVITAVVFGRVWRYCQMEDRVCRASLETIGQDLKLNRSTIMDHVRILVRDGYLADLTPDLRNHPHTYADTGKAGLEGRVSAVVKGNTGVVINNTGKVTTRTGVVLDNSGVGQNNTGVVLDHLKIGEDRNKTDQDSGAGAPEQAILPFPAEKAKREGEDTPHQLLFGAICGLCGWSMDTLAKKDQSRVGRAAGVLGKAGYTADDVSGAFRQHWYSNTWQGRDKQQRPTPEDIQREIGNIRKSAQEGSGRVARAANGGMYV